MKIWWGGVALERLRGDVASFFGNPNDLTSPRGRLEQNETAIPESISDVPWQWPLIIGDAIHSYRSALDHLAWEVAILCRERRGESGPPSRLTQFPIADSAENFERQAARQLLDFGELERETAERLQPYRDPPGSATGPLSEDPLTWLRELSNRDKHRSLNLAVVGSGTTDVALIGPFQGWAMIARSRSNLVTIRAMEDSIELVLGGGLEVRQTYEVRFEDPDERIDWVLDAIEPRIDKIVAAFAPLFRRDD
jgi:hypothetical protein